MNGERTRAACPKASDEAARFDWATWNADLDAALARWNASEAELSQLHIDTARDLSAAFDAIQENNRG